MTHTDPERAAFERGFAKAKEMARDAVHSSRMKLPDFKTPSYWRGSNDQITVAVRAVSALEPPKESK